MFAAVDLSDNLSVESREVLRGNTSLDESHSQPTSVRIFLTSFLHGNQHLSEC